MPYRTSARPEPSPDEPPPGRSDDRVILWLGVAVGAVACVPPLLGGGRWGAQSTLGLIIAVVSAVMLIHELFVRGGGA